MTIRLGVVGLGGVSVPHMQAIDSLDSVEIVSVCDSCVEIADKVAAKYTAAVYYDYEELIDARDIDLLLVLTPASTHRDIVLRAAKNGLHILCEKPLAITVSDAEDMVAACDDAEVFLFYGSCYRYLPALTVAREMIQAGIIGDTRLMMETLVTGSGSDGYCELSPVHYPPGGPGGSGVGLVDHGVHLIDVFSWLIQSNVIGVSGSGQIAGEPPLTEVMTLMYENGAVGQLVYNSATYSTALPAEGVFAEGEGYAADGTIIRVGHWIGDPLCISVHGSLGALRILYYANKLYLFNEAGIRNVPLRGRPAMGHFTTQLERCVASINKGECLGVDGRVGIEVLERLLRVYSSGRMFGESFG